MDDMDLDEEVHILRVLDSADYLPVPTPLPEKRPAVPDVERMVVTSSMIRRIGYELKHGECDPRTVFNFCRGLERGSLEFENAYIAARLRSYARHQRFVTDPLPGSQSDAGDALQNPCRNTMNRKTPPPPPHPMAVYHLGHLMSHLGIWVIALLGSQAWAAWRVSALANTYLEGGRPLYFAIALFALLATDSAIWFRRRGRLCDAFFVPGAVLLLLSLLTLLTLHVREVLLAMH
jgi:hypothetical protein